MPPLKAGDRVPDDVTLRDGEGRSCTLQNLHRPGRWLVVFFYPRDHTRVCTRQACGFRDRYAAFREAGADVIGISGDPPGSHREFATRHQLPFPLYSDPGNAARRRFGVPSFLFWLPGRATYVIDPQGVIRLVFSAPLDAEAHVRQALALLRDATPPSC